MAFKRDIKVRKVNRNFNINVRLYYDNTSFNRTVDTNPRFYLEPVKLNWVERLAFTEGGARDNKYINVANRYYGGRNLPRVADERQSESARGSVRSVARPRAACYRAEEAAHVKGGEAEAETEENDDKEFSQGCDSIRRAARPYFRLTIR